MRYLPSGPRLGERLYGNLNRRVGIDAVELEEVDLAPTQVHKGVFDLAALQSWCESRLSQYKLPRRLTIVKSLPRNAMGKVTKPAVRDLFAE